MSAVEDAAVAVLHTAHTHWAFQPLRLHSARLCRTPEQTSKQPPAHPEAAIHSMRGLSHHLPPRLARSLADRPDGAQPGEGWPVFSPERPMQAHY